MIEPASPPLAPPAPLEVPERLRERTEQVEAVVLRAWAGTFAEKYPTGFALVATGGYGRREQFPCSDVDLLIVVETEAQMDAAKATISEFLQRIWDAGMRPSHSVHTIVDCVTEHEHNAELTISLLDRRHIAGDGVLYKALDKKFGEFITRRGAAIARKLSALAELRRGKFQNTIFHLEPNIKDTPGGLRDLQTVHWLAALHERPEAPGLEAAFDFLAALRIRLHEFASRDSNILTFDAQEALAENPADLMREYYRHARTVDRAVRGALEAEFEQSGSLLGRFHDWRSRLSNQVFTVSRERVLLRTLMPTDLSLFEFVARHQLRLAPDTMDRLYNFVPSATWVDWKRLLALPHASLGLRAMQDTGTLRAALPEWRNIECLVVRDFYHRYTVDEHTLVAIGALESVADGRFAGLLEEIHDKALLKFALLLHDTGKGSGHEHVGESRRIARAVLERLGAPDEDRATIEFLISKHLELSNVMTGRDVHDSSTARMLAEQVGTIERLKLLAMLTYADISAVNPQAMSPWRLEQLWQVYILAHEELTAELETERIHNAAGVDPERASFLEGLPTRYLRTHTQAEIDGHFELARQVDTRPVAIEILREPGAYKLTLLTRDRAGLFASVAGAISSFGLNILHAEAFSNAQGLVVDIFTFADPHRALELNPPEVDRLRGIVRKVVEGRQDAGKLLRGRPKPLLPSRASRLKPQVSFNNEASDAATLIEIVAEDRPGLLYQLSSAISDAGCNIEVVLIHTEAHRAIDVFYVTAQGRKLDADIEARLKAGLIAACNLT